MDLVLGWNQDCRDELMVFVHGETIGVDRWMGTTDGHHGWAGVRTRGRRDACSHEHPWRLDSGF